MQEDIQPVFFFFSSQLIFLKLHIFLQKHVLSLKILNGHRFSFLSCKRKDLDRILHIEGQTTFKLIVLLMSSMVNLSALPKIHITEVFNMDMFYINLCFILHIVLLQKTMT